MARFSASKLLPLKLKPAAGYSGTVHLGLLILLPLAMFVLIRLGDTFTRLAYAIVLLSKWRMFAVRPRFWLAIIRANSVDIIVGLSVVLFMTHSSSQWLQLVWAAAYGVWLIYLKPATSMVMTAIQAAIGQLFGLMAIYSVWAGQPFAVLILSTGAVCLLSARHFFDTFDEPYAKLLAYFWGYLGAALAWLLSHWLLFYGPVAQPTLLLSVIGYGLAGLYYFDHSEKLSSMLKWQFIYVMGAIIAVILAFSDWGDKVV
ncbi:hypothetical protein H7097_00100 [Aeromicrobium sp.]|nr:hypothetical protein [Candidatus Saccharibacteria bacterium]